MRGPLFLQGRAHYDSMAMIGGFSNDYTTQRFCESLGQSLQYEVEPCHLSRLLGQ